MRRVVTPCRIVDTRVGGGGTFGPNDRRSFRFSGTGSEFATQGGRAGGCGILADAASVEASVSAVGPRGSGYLRAWPTEVTPPSATFLNYSDRQNITNTGAVTVSPGTPRGVTVENYGGSVDYVIDVQGFFVRTSG